MTEVPQKPSRVTYTHDEWEGIYRRSFAVSARVLDLIEEEMGEGSIVNPQAAGVVLVLCMGRLQGRYGYRTVNLAASWAGWTSPELLPLFETAFRNERAQED